MDNYSVSDTMDVHTPRGCDDRVSHSWTPWSKTLRISMMRTWASNLSYRCKVAYGQWRLVSSKGTTWTSLEICVLQGCTMELIATEEMANKTGRIDGLIRTNSKGWELVIQGTDSTDDSVPRGTIKNKSTIVSYQLYWSGPSILLSIDNTNKNCIACRNVKRMSTPI